MALDERLAETYLATDSATLLSLLPELRRLQEQWHRHMRLVHDGVEASKQADADIAETFAEVLATFHGRLPADDAVERANFEQLRDELAAVRRKVHQDRASSAVEIERAMVQWDQARSAERWILAELGRRRLLPS